MTFKQLVYLPPFCVHQNGSKVKAFHLAVIQQVLASLSKNPPPPIHIISLI